ncbi:unnamed protein product [Pocillopora meandrina]|uniref:Tyrosine-protein kinase ephrin type A/B receptor-like domain-containing protein n=1 Tax=Pocillopora meandrina TaxID=46732 RepID=A0AAU9WEM3_9CNID|nr:unnamed protein product [Pocillopora meandrina]
MAALYDSEAALKFQPGSYKSRSSPVLKRMKNFVPLFPAVNFFHLGCFKDYPIRAIPEVLGVWRLESNATQRCAQAAKRAGYLVFGVQDGGECWSGPLAQETYKKYGASTRCVGGTGWAWAQDVYRIVNPPLIGNYDVKRCYVLDVIFNYRIPGGLTVNTTRNVIGEFQSLFLVVQNLYLSLQQCKEVIITIGNIASSPPGVSLVYFRVPLTFTASNNIADDQMAINVTTCVNAANVSLKGYIDRSAPNITQNKITYQINQQSSLEKKSCCGGDILPPCCAVGSIKISNTSCGCLPGFHHVTGRSCVPCPSDTYQDEQGQKSCKTCPANTVTFGKTRMTNKANCTGCLPGFHFVTGRSCVSCPSDTYQNEHGQKYCKTCPVNTGTFGKTRMTNQANCTEASLISNYDIMRCYEVDITFHYQIDGGLTNSTITNTKVQFSSLFQQVPGLLSFNPKCSGVVVTRKDILSSPPGVKSIFFTIPMIFTASTNVADGQISTKIVDCISTLTASYKGFIDRNTPSISQNGTHTTYNTSTISEKRSCCGGNIPPPCCTVGSVNVSSSKCGCLPGFHFVPGSLCQRCPSDTYQDEQGQSSCKKCPGRKQTFGKTGMTSNSSCLGEL